MAANRRYHVGSRSTVVGSLDERREQRDCAFAAARAGGGGNCLAQTNTFAMSGMPSQPPPAVYTSILGGSHSSDSSSCRSPPLCFFMGSQGQCTSRTPTSSFRFLALVTFAAPPATKRQLSALRPLAYFALAMLTLVACSTLVASLFFDPGFNAKLAVLNTIKLVVVFAYAVVFAVYAAIFLTREQFLSLLRLWGMDRDRGVYCYGVHRCGARPNSSIFIRRRAIAGGVFSGPPQPLRGGLSDAFALRYRRRRSHEKPLIGRSCRYCRWQLQ